MLRPAQPCSCLLTGCNHAVRFYMCTCSSIPETDSNDIVIEQQSIPLAYQASQYEN